MLARCGYGTTPPPKNSLHICDTIIFTNITNHHSPHLTKTHQVLLISLIIMIAKSKTTKI